VIKEYNCWHLFFGAQGHPHLLMDVPAIRFIPMKKSGCPLLSGLGTLAWNTEPETMVN